MIQKPTQYPKQPFFSSGPCAKRPGWTLDSLQNAFIGRSHRHKEGIARINEIIEKSKKILNMPKDYLLAVVPGSDTGAIEMAMWSLLGERGVDVLAWDVFGKQWAIDIINQLKIKDVRSFESPFGHVPNFDDVDTDRDVVFTWNGTTAGVKVPHTDWIKSNRKGLTICDATSAVFAMDLPWEKLDVITWSWQKALGSEAAHGMLAISPRAVERLESYTPPWPLPKLFRLTKSKKFFAEPFEGKTINTPSMLAIEDCADALRWVESIGGLQEMLKRSEANLAAVTKWLNTCEWAKFLAENPETISSTSICFKVTDPWFLSLPETQHASLIKSVEKMLEKDGIAYEIANHRDAPPSFRLWGGATVDTADIEHVLPWIDWAYNTLKSEIKLNTINTHDLKECRNDKSID